MSSTQNQLNGAIARSISHDEIVTVRVGAEENMKVVFYDLCHDPLCEEYEYVDASATLREVWGKDEDGNEWRVHLMQDERSGAARFHERAETRVHQLAALLDDVDDGSVDLGVIIRQALKDDPQATGADIREIVAEARAEQRANLAAE